MNDQRFKQLRSSALAVGLVGAVIAVAGLFLSEPQQFFQSYLAAYLFWFGLTMGALAVLLLHYLVTGGWGYLIQPGLEAVTRGIWLAPILFLPIVLGLPALYPWARPEALSDPVVQNKALYLNVPFFLIRAGLYFAIWLGLSRLLVGWSSRAEYTLDPVYRRRRQQLSAVGLILYVLTMSFAAIDWIMGLNPEWVSTIFGLLLVTGQALAGMALGIALLPSGLRYQALADWATPNRIRDLGALLLTLVIFWAYIAFSQYLIVWSGNIPREVTWFIDRSEGGWILLFLIVLVVQFGLPFAALMSLQAKRSLRIVGGLSLAILVMRWLDTIWMVLPAFHPQQIALHWLDFILPVALGGLWVAVLFRNLERAQPPLLPVENRLSDMAEERQGTVR